MGDAIFHDLFTFYYCSFTDVVVLLWIYQKILISEKLIIVLLSVRMIFAIFIYFNIQMKIFS